MLSLQRHYQWLSHDNYADINLSQALKDETFSQNQPLSVKYKDSMKPRFSVTFTRLCFITDIP